MKWRRFPCSRLVTLKSALTIAIEFVFTAGPLSHETPKPPLFGRQIDLRAPRALLSYRSGEGVRMGPID